MFPANFEPGEPDEIIELKNLGKAGGNRKG
jgi:hypothetical protein